MQTAIAQAQAGVTASNSSEGKARALCVAGLTDEKYLAVRWAAGASVKPLMGLSESQFRNLG